MDRPLTARQERFVQEYLLDLNATQAAIRAGYSKRGAKVQGHRLLTDANVSRAIEGAKSARSARVEVTADDIVRDLLAVKSRCMQAAPVMVWDRSAKEMVQATDDAGQGIWEFDSTGANRALELLGKHVGMFTEKHEITGPGIVRFEMDMFPKDSKDKKPT